MSFLLRLFASKAQQNSDAPQPSTPITATGYLAYCAAGLFIATSTFFGMWFGFSFGSQYHVAVGCALALGALAGELIKPVAVKAVIDGAKRVNLAQLSIGLLLAIVTITYSFIAEYSLSSQMRGNSTADRASTIETATLARDKRTRAKAQLDALPLTKPEASLRAEIKSLLQTPGASCDAAPGSKAFGKVSRRVCPQVAKLKSELAVASQRRMLERKVLSAESQIASLGKDAGIKHADKTAADIAALGSTFGYQWKAEHVAVWIALLIPLFLELGSAFGLTLAGLCSGRVTERVTPMNKGASDNDEDLPAPPSVTVLEADETATAKSNVVKLLQGQGGSLQAAQRKLADMVGVSVAQINRAIKELVDDGIVVAQSHKTFGTRLTLATA